MPHAATSPQDERRGPLGPAALTVLVCVLFTLSGAVGLIYQVAWKHVFTSVFGSTTYAISVVISVFMAGLALGSYVFGGVADRSRRHLLLFAGLQAGVGLSALLVPVALRSAEGLYSHVFRAYGSAGLLTATQVLVGAAVLVVPTFLMGGTLPVLSRLVAGWRGQVAAAVGLLYGLNTLGAAAGAFVTGFVLIEAFGTARTMLLAVAANLGLAACFLVMHLLSGPSAAVEPVAPEEAPAVSVMPAWRAHIVLMIVTISGFVSFSYEVLWTRLLTFRFESTVYAFSTMLTAFLLGLGLGGALVGLLGRAVSRRRYWTVLGLLEAGVGLWGLATVVLFLSRQQGHATFAGRVVAEFGVSAGIMLMPTTLLGAAFPIACHLYASGVRQTGRSVGTIYVCNTVGAVSGALLTGFALVRWLGTETTLEAVSLLILAGASVVLLTREGAGRSALRRWAPVGAVWLAAALVWYLTPSNHLRDYLAETQRRGLEPSSEPVELLGFSEDVEGITVAVRMPDGERLLSTGSTDVAGTAYTLRNTQKLQAHVPMLLHPDPREVVQVGFGSGETARIFVSYGPERYDCVEISRAVLEVADGHFRDINGDVLHDPACNVILMDAAAYLRYADQRYDIVANDATWPNLAGPVMLYTLEYFRNGRRHLKPGGIMTSWLPLELPPEDFKSILKTFSSVFPHAYVWTSLSHRNKHALLIGSDRPLRVDIGRFLERFNRLAREDLAVVHLDDPAGFLTGLLASVDEMGPDLEGIPLNTTDRTVVAYATSRLQRLPAWERAQLMATSLSMLVAHRASVADYLTGLERLDEPDAFLSQLDRLEQATALLLRRAIVWHREPVLSAELAERARRLGPEHPGVRFMDAEAATRQLPWSGDLASYTVQELERLGARLMLMAFYGPATEVYRELLRRDPESAEAMGRLGTCYFNRGMPAEAVRYLEAALSIDPQLLGAYLELGFMALRAGQIERAVAYLERAVEIDPGSSEAHGRLGTAYMAAGQPGRAAPHLREAIELNPSAASAHGNLGVVLMGEGRDREAIKHLHRMAELQPDSVRAHALLAAAYRSAGDEQAAEHHAQRANELARLSAPVQ